MSSVTLWRDTYVILTCGCRCSTFIACTDEQRHLFCARSTKSLSKRVFTEKDAVTEDEAELSEASMKRLNEKVGIAVQYILVQWQLIQGEAIVRVKLFEIKMLDCLQITLFMREFIATVILLMERASLLKTRIYCRLLFVIGYLFGQQFTYINLFWAKRTTMSRAEVNMLQMRLPELWSSEKDFLQSLAERTDPKSPQYRYNIAIYVPEIQHQNIRKLLDECKLLIAEVRHLSIFCFACLICCSQCFFCYGDLCSRSLYEKAPSMKSPP